MKVPLATGVRHQSGFFKQVGVDLGAGDLVFSIQLHLDELTKSGTVVITTRQGVTCGEQRGEKVKIS